MDPDPDPYISLMDADPDSDPALDPTSFFSDFKDAKNLSHIFFF